ncbi:MAG: DUF3472 domain-containing protein [Phycisphaerae bacterium]|nr:DUF3472 domain-containing protein [Phycisphaerae bacterium]
MQAPRGFIQLIITLALATICHAGLRVPAYTAYLDPDVRGARMSEAAGITRWTDPTLKVWWFGQIRTKGSLDCAVELTLPQGTTSRLRLTVAGQSSEVSVTGTGTQPVTAEFGSFKIEQAEYQKFTLESLDQAGQPFGDVKTLILNGKATENAHFNLKERRNAASVHLAYPVPANTKVAAFYCEMTALEDPIWSYYMACGWHRGYFGMQVNSPTERRIIFSVWDSGNEAVDRDKVNADNRVTLVGKGEDVFSGSFGNEGTGGHSHLKFPWKTGETQRFMVTAEPTDATHTIYSGFYFHPDKKVWILISSWRAPKEGGYMRGLYSFSENFSGANGHTLRKALYGSQWIRTDQGQWIELTTATFSHDATGKADRLDRFMGVQDGQFFLSHGGFVPGFTQYGTAFTRPATGQAPDLVLPEIQMEGQGRLPVPPEGFQWERIDALSDEFQGTSLDTAKWSPLHPYWKGRTPSQFAAENVTVDRGLLLLRSTTDVTDLSDVADPNKDPWVSSACVSSLNPMASYGYYETRFKASALCMTSSFWFQGRYSEIDVVEQVGRSQKLPAHNQQMLMNTHYFKQGWSQDQATPKQWTMPSGSADAYHTYGMWWKDNKTVCFYHNGERVAEVNLSVEFNEPMYLFFDTEVFKWDGMPSLEALKDPQKNTMRVDWVRAWRLNAIH